MTTTDETFNRIWVDGVPLSSVQSGEVSAAEEIISSALQHGGGWIDVPTATGSYKLRVSDHTSIIVEYVNL